MQSSLDCFAKAVRMKRLERELSQRDLADKLNMSMRTIINIEKNRSNPKMETIVILAKELNISLDSLIFDHQSSTIPKCVLDFFAGKSEDEAKKYIDLCKQALKIST
ncbi:helix-turn-helix domain-containing protein [Anaerotignum sp.]|uniref:helix-turn-helix domain-containing protein n=1 Tax=Anaerotignum sp. TaxID=2039241 RepID=UPI0028AEA4C8|nr:helix-turn-helix transcriptional regulator [Anaerotignum sp.]